MYGNCCVKSYSKTQSTIAQSSAESELIGTVRAATEALGLISLANDLGIVLKAGCTLMQQQKSASLIATVLVE